MKSDSKYKYMALAVLYVLPLLLASAYYVDDMGRSYRGYGWDADGRNFASLIVNAMSFGNGVMSSFPYSTIISAVIFLYCGYLLVDMLSKAENINKILLSSILLTSPFLLENLAYRYDSIPMAISLLVVISPYRLINNRLFIPASTISVFLSLGLYQISAIFFVSVGLLFMMHKVIDSKTSQAIILGVKIALAFAFGYAAYTLFIHYVGTQINRASFLPVEYESVYVIKNRMAEYASNIILLCKSGYYYVLTFIVLSFLYATVVSIYKRGFEGVMSLMLYLLLLSLLVITTMMPNLVIKTAWITARTFLGFPLVILALLLYLNNSRVDKKNNISIIVCSLSLAFSLFICSQFAAVLKNNEEYNNFIASTVTSIVGGNNNGSTPSLAVVGKSHGGRKGYLMYSYIPFLKVIAPQYMSNGWGWGGISLTRFRYFNWTPKVNDKCNLDVIFYGGDFVIRSDADRKLYVIDFEYKSCK